MPTRRTLIAGGASMALLAGCGGRKPRTLAGSAADLPALRDRLAAEYAQIALVRESLDALDGEARALARTIVEHDRQHAEALAEAIRELGGAPPAAESSQPEAASLDELVRLKERASAAYAAAIPKLANPRLRGTFGAVMTAEAEHAAALGLAR